MWYASFNQAGTDPIEGGIEITEAQYIEAVDGLTNGLEVTITNGFAVGPAVPPPPPEPQPPTEAEILAAQSAKLQGFVQLASAQKTALSNRISDLESAIENIGVEGQEEFAATPEEQAEYPVRKTQLTKWKNYSILLGRVTTQAGWYSTVTWPPQPADGMDLTVSALMLSTA